jgi:hypothetical protein
MVKGSGEVKDESGEVNDEGVGKWLSFLGSPLGTPL